MALTLTDPRIAPAPRLPFVKRIFGQMLNEERDLVFVDLALTQSLVLMSLATLMFWRFRWGIAAGYLGLIFFYWLGPYVLMLHNTSHRRLFSQRYGLFNYYIPVVLSPFFGETPLSYFAHHLGMHHAENNLRGDLSSTMRFQRDSFIDFMRYFLRFFFGIIVEMPAYLWRKKRHRLLVQSLGGEIVWFGLVVLAWMVEWRAALVVLVLPYVVCRFGMMAGNWAQHAFIDASAPENCYRNSLTCINSAYNRRCFNDGYHIGHHVRATRHWTEMPGDLEAQTERYAREDAIVIERVDFFLVWLFLMLKRYDWLAERMVDLGAQRTIEQRIALLRTRTARMPEVSTEASHQTV